MAVTNEGIKTFTAGEDLAVHRRVKKSGDTVVYADAGEDYIAITEDAASSGDPVACRLKNVSGTVKVVCAGAVAVNSDLYGAADGKVDDAVSGTAQFYSITEAGSGDGSIIEALPINT